MSRTPTAPDGGRDAEGPSDRGPAPLLSVEQVVKRYSSGSEIVTALDGASVTVAPGEMLAMQGPSGSGKTTLLLLAAGALLADEGTVRFDGIDLASLGEQQSAQFRLSEVGLIAQNAHLMARVSAVENAATKLLLGGMSAEAARERAAVWIERVGLTGAAGRAPEELLRGRAPARRGRPGARGRATADPCR